MTDRQAAAGFALLLICFTTYLCFRGIAWCITNGWRSMLGLVALRGEGVVQWQDCDVKDRNDWDFADVEAVATLVREVAAEERTEEDEDAEASDFRLWHAELSGEKRIVKNLRRMDRWSR